MSGDNRAACFDMNFISVKNRFLVSVAANAFRALITFAAGVIVARGLNPSGYGDLSFLLGSFVAIRALMDMGSSSAFYTFLSRYAREKRFYLFYFSWLAIQFVITLTLVYLVTPAELFERIWLGHSREIVVLAFVAAFMQQQVWQMVGQRGESTRKTVKVQILNVFVAVANLTAVWLLLLSGNMTVERMLLLTIGLYALATLLSYRVLRSQNVQLAKEGEVTIAQMFDEYWVYCKPLIIYSVVSFLYAFADKWMLQKFGGAAQQGYFQIALHFAQVSLLASVSILNIFWKEIAEASAKADHARVAFLYQKTTRGLVMLSAIVAGLLLPWAKQIVAFLLGPTYVEAWPVLAIMFLYPIHQSMGQIGGTMFLASGHTKKYVVLSIATMLVTLPVAYFCLAPTEGMLIPGLGLGAIGMACYMVLTNIAAVNVQAWVISRHNGWRFDWLYQVIGIPMILGAGYFAKTVVGLVWNLDGSTMAGLVVPVMLSCLVYVVIAILLVWFFPWLAGIEREGIRHMFSKLRKGVWRAQP